MHFTFLYQHEENDSIIIHLVSLSHFLVLFRCGNNFCATHRYAESHDCTFDYKSEGRKLLEQSNPVVNAPKLPKI